MINVNPTKGLLESRALRKVQKKDNKVKFSKTIEASKNTGNENDSIALSAINPFLFLQEVDEYKNDQEKLKEEGNKILKGLNELRWGLINNELNEQIIINLKNMLKQSTHKFKFLELQNVIDDIVLRCEVEIAKIEKNRKN